MNWIAANNALLALGVEDVVVRAGILSAAVESPGTAITTYTLGGNTFTGFSVTAASGVITPTQFTVAA